MVTYPELILVGDLPARTVVDRIWDYLGSYPRFNATEGNLKLTTWDCVNELLAAYRSINPEVASRPNSPDWDCKKAAIHFLAAINEVPSWRRCAKIYTEGKRDLVAEGYPHAFILFYGVRDMSLMPALIYLDPREAGTRLLMPEDYLPLPAIEKQRKVGIQDLVFV